MNPESQKVDTAYLSRAFPSEFHSKKLVQNVTQLAGDVSTRRYYRIRGATETYVLQLAEPFASSSEHPFLAMRALLSDWGIPVPALRGADGASGAILLEDLGDDMLHGSPSLSFYRKAIDYISIWSRCSYQLKGQTPSLHFRQFFDVEKLNAEMKFTAEHLIGGLLKGDGAKFLSATLSNSQFLESRSRVLCHRDYHSKNLMLWKNTLYVIDFQDARIGPVTYDIVSLLWDPYVRLSESWKDELLSYWHQSIDGTPGLVSIGWEEELERMKVQRLLKAMGSYAAFYRNRGRNDYLNCVRPTYLEVCHSLRALEDLNCSLEQDKTLLGILESQKWAHLDGL